MKLENIKERERKIVEREQAIRSKVGEKRETLFERFPLPFTLLGAFGLVATLYGFEKIIDKIDFFSNNPWILLATGLVALFVTGSLYNKL